MMTAVALLSCKKKRKLYALQLSQWEPPEAAVRSFLSCVKFQGTVN